MVLPFESTLLYAVRTFLAYDKRLHDESACVAKILMNIFSGDFKFPIVCYIGNFLNHFFDHVLGEIQ